VNFELVGRKMSAENRYEQLYLAGEQDVQLMRELIEELPRPSGYFSADKEPTRPLFRLSLYFHKYLPIFFFGWELFEAADFIRGPDGEAGADVEFVAVVGAGDAPPVQLSLSQVAGSVGAEGAEGVDDPADTGQDDGGIVEGDGGDSAVFNLGGGRGVGETFGGGGKAINQRLLEEKNG
jgi:hypothetical protein